MVNGYPLPWGGSGIAVRRACEIILSQPGVPQHDVMVLSAKFANISVNNSSWIVSPGKKSPALKLWNRERVGKKFLCYPNEFTKDLVGAYEAKREEWLKRNLTIVQGGAIPVKGDIVEVRQHVAHWSNLPKEWHHALFIGWTNRDIATPTLEELGKLVDYNSYANFTVMLNGSTVTTHSARVRVCK